jgi:exonuclease III
MFVKEVLLQLKSHIDPHTLIVGDFNTPLSLIGRLLRQKLNREMPELIGITNQMNLTDIYRTFHPNTKEYTFFSAPHETFSKTDHILRHKSSLNR